MSLQAENYDPALKAGAVINASNDIALTSAYLLVGNSSGLATGVALSGDATIDNTGAITVASSNAGFSVGTTFTTGSTTTSSGAGAVAITGSIHEITTTGADALTLADGAEGQHLNIVMVADGGAGTLTPTNFASGSTMTFDDVGDTAHLLFTAGAWYFMGGTATVA